MNKKYYLGIFVGVVVLVGAFGIVSSGLFFDNSSESASVSSLQKGLVGHWTLEGVDYNSNTNRVTDKSAYSNHGTNYGATLTSDRGGLSEGAMSFDGSNDYIRIEDTPSTDETFGLTDTYTISAWAYPNSWANWATIINKASGSSWSNTLNGLWAYTSGFRCVMGSGVGGNPSGSSIGPTYNPGLNEWHHIVCVADGTNLKIYVNGVYRGQNSISSLTYPRSDIDDPVVIGRRAVSVNPTFDGRIDEIKAYNRALSEEEIKLLYDSYKPKVVSGSTQKGLILDMPLSSRYTKTETSGSEVITDRTPYSNDGQNYGATLGSDGASFDGVDNYVKINNVFVSNPSELTISGWIKKESGGGTYECALHHGSDSSIGNSAYWFGVDNSDYLTATIGARTGVGWAAGKTSILANYGEWYHLIASWDGSVVKVYVNGDYVKQYSLGSYSSLITPTRIGASTDGTNYEFSGDISNVKIYNRALSAEEIKSLYDKGRY